jgi:hypothetical protein
MCVAEAYQYVPYLPQLALESWFNPTKASARLMMGDDPQTP